MTDPGKRPRYTSMLAAGIVVVLTLAITGCGSTSSQSSSAATSATNASSGQTDPGLSHATAQIAKYTPTVNVVPAGPAFDESKDAGKTVWYIPLIATVPAIESVAGDMQHAFSVAGVKWHECDGQGTPIGWNACIRQAITFHPAAIVLDSITPASVKASIQAARAAGIPVDVDAAYDSTHPKYPLAYSATSYDYTLGARLTADWIIADSKGAAHVFVIDTSDLSLRGDVTVNGYQYEFSHYCPGCKVTVGEVTSIADWATDVTPLVQNALKRDPSINYVVAEYDAQALYAAPAITQLGLGSKVKIAGYNADLDQMQAMERKTQPIFVDVGSDQNSLAWAEADNALRAMAGVAPVVKENTGTRVFTRDNVGSLSLTNAGYYSGAWYGSNSFEAAYKKLWGIG